MTRTRSALVFAGTVAAAFWFYGFLHFVGAIELLREPGVGPELEDTDAIVVLTGGSERLTTGLELMESGNAKKLFISGVHPNLTLSGVFGAQPVPASLRDCCIALGFRAGSTIGNAEETREWMRAQAYQSLRLVTANYHMPRSLMLFRAAMPGVKIIPHPVTPDSVKLYQWWRHPGTVKLLVVEYDKFLLSAVRVWVMGL